MTGGVDSSPLSPQSLGTDLCWRGDATSIKKLALTAAPLTLTAGTSLMTSCIGLSHPYELFQQLLPQGTTL